LVSGYTLQTYTDAVFPFIDALTTWGAIIATYMVAKKLIENWIYWFVIDAISVFLFLSRDLVFTSLLFVSYLIIIYFGYKSWKKILKEQKKETI
jgi:nicotinamide mononucleotide transporter